MIQDPIAKPPDVHMEAARTGSDRRKPNNSNPEQVIKCPRCESLNTKFCYYNNYSLTQPRHFCKNCRRYWTQGGSLRNVPIGGGCRKNKRIKQRSIDPHIFGGLEDHGGPGSFLHVGGAGGGLLSSSCFGPQGVSAVPGFSDLMPSNDSHLLSMAFSRLQESLRLGEQGGDGALVNSNPAKLSLMHNSPLYEHSLLGYPHSNVKPEHAYTGSELGNFFDPSSGSHMGSTAASLAPLEEQLANFGVPVDHSFNTCSLEGQLKLQHQKQLALHLGAASDHEVNAGGSANTSNGGVSSGVEHRRAHPHTHASAHMHHREHGALPDFEEHESPESMTSMQLMRRSAAMAMSNGKTGVQESWHQGVGAAGDHPQEARHTLLQNMGHLQISSGAGEMHQQQAHQSGYHESVTGNVTAGDQQMISFWSPSPWSDHMHTSTPAGALL